MSERLCLSVIGTGYLGATHAICMAELGHDVVALDTDPAKISLLQAGVLPFSEPGLQELLTQVRMTGRLHFTLAYDDVAGADVHFVCVGTPQSNGSPAADLHHVEDAIWQLAPRVKPGALVVGKSTVPVGTAARLSRLLRSASGGVADLAWNPEFLREGHAVEDTLRPDRLVLGVTSDAARERLEAVYARLLAGGTPVVVTDLATAELVKEAANSFLATKISYINAMAEVCDAVGADVLSLARALGHDPRIGERYLAPGLGYGGGCLPKDLRAFVHQAERLGVGHATRFLREIDALNDNARDRSVELVREAAGGSLHGRQVAALGAAFKPGTDDVRDSPALAVASRLQAEGALVRVYDPQAMAAARRALPDLCTAGSLEETLRGADVTVLLTEWPEFTAIDPVSAARMVGRTAVVDARHALDPSTWRRAGWRYWAPGRPRQSGSLRAALPVTRQEDPPATVRRAG